MYTLEVEGPVTQKSQIITMQLSFQLGYHVLCELSVTLLINNTWNELIFRKIMPLC